MKTMRNCFVPVVVLSILSFVTTVQADLITSTTNLPPAGVYLGPDIHQIYGGAALQFLLTLPEHKPFADQVDRHRGGMQPDGTVIGDPNDEIETFGSTLDAMLEVKVNGISQGPAQPIQAIGPFGSVMTLVKDRLLSPDGTGSFDTEMLQLNLSGTSPFGPFMIRESPTLASTGHTNVTDIGGGLYRINSFFDVFTELSIDGGATWVPGHDASGAPLAGRVELFPLPQQTVPEPGSIVLFGVGALGLVAGLRRRKK